MSVRVRIFRLFRLSREILSLANFTNIYRETPDSVKIGQETRALDMTTEVYFQISDRDIQTRDVATLQRTHCSNSTVTLSILIMFLTTCVSKKIQNDCIYVTIRMVKRTRHYVTLQYISYLLRTSSEETFPEFSELASLQPKQPRQIL